MIGSILAGALFLYMSYCAGLFVLQRQILFPANALAPMPDAARLVPHLETHWLDLPFGKVETWFLPAAAPIQPSRAPAVIFAHGNGELIDYWPQDLYPFTRMGLGVLMVEYPGYGRSTGRATELSVRQTFAAAYDWLTARPDVDPERIVLVGRSLGGGAVCTIAGERRSAAMILMSTFTGVKGMAAKFFAPPFLIRDPFDNLAAVENYHRPLLIIHGDHDDVVPYSHGVKLHRAAPQSEMITYDSGHNDCPPDWHHFYKTMDSFFRKNGILPDSQPTSPSA